MQATALSTLLNNNNNNNNNNNSFRTIQRFLDESSPEKSKCKPSRSLHFPGKVLQFSCALNNRNIDTLWACHCERCQVQLNSTVPTRTNFLLLQKF